jgi:hypothetical protein
VSVRKLVSHTGSTPPKLDIRNPSGSVTVEAVDGVEEVEVRVEPLDSAAEQLLDLVEIDVSAADPDRAGSPARIRVAVPERRLFRSPSFAVFVSAPAGAAARVAVASADMELRGRLGRCELTSASGDVAVERCEELQVRTASGDARIGAVTGRTTVGTASGDLRILSAEGGLEVRTASGDVEVETTAGTVSLSTASGDVRLGAVSAGQVQLKTVSGDVEIGVVPGLRVWLDLSSVSGRMESQLDDDGPAAGGPAQLNLSMRSVSGDLRIRRAAVA